MPLPAGPLLFLYGEAVSDLCPLYRRAGGHSGRPGHMAAGPSRAPMVCGDAASAGAGRRDSASHSLREPEPAPAVDRHPVWVWADQPSAVVRHMGIPPGIRLWADTLINETAERLPRNAAAVRLFSADIAPAGPPEHHADGAEEAPRRRRRTPAFVQGASIGPVMNVRPVS